MSSVLCSVEVTPFFLAFSHCSATAATDYPTIFSCVCTKHCFTGFVLTHLSSLPHLFCIRCILALVPVDSMPTALRGSTTRASKMVRLLWRPCANVQHSITLKTALRQSAVTTSSGVLGNRHFAIGTMICITVFKLIEGPGGLVVTRDTLVLLGMH